MTHIEWASYISAFDKDNTKGDVLEFGVACAGTIRDVAFINPEKTIYGFDHFQGLNKLNNKHQTMQVGIKEHLDLEVQNTNRHTIKFRRLFTIS